MIITQPAVGISEKMLTFAAGKKMIMAKNGITPDFLFETSWEVCNKVGGIFTVLSSRAHTLQQQLRGTLIFIGPDLGNKSHGFTEDNSLLPDWKAAAAAQDLQVRIGRWDVPGNPICVLVDFQPFFDQKNEIYAQAWEKFHVDSLHAYGDYDEASMFSYAAGRFVEIVVKSCIPEKSKVVYQAHEWMSGLGMLFLKHQCPGVATIFTTHATSIGRSIAGNNKLLYEYFHGYNGDQMAAELNMEAKHSIEKQSAHGAYCFTTVSKFTDHECAHLLDKSADIVLPNGFEAEFVPKGVEFTRKRKAARAKVIRTMEALTGTAIKDDVLIVSTSGRNDFRCKGFDVYMEALAQLNARLKADGPADASATQVLALIEVPCWMEAPRSDLQERLNGKEKAFEEPLPNPYITHTLHNMDEDRILGMMRHLGLTAGAGDPVKVLLIPCYLDVNDGIFNMPYYDFLTANDLCIYPSYYEPWGYTPLESCAFRTPCVTTDLSGFGQWVNEVLGHNGEIEDGVRVIHRTDTNYFESARKVCETIRTMLETPTKERTALGRAAAKLAQKALWKNFIRHYFDAYTFALKKTETKQ